MDGRVLCLTVLVSLLCPSWTKDPACLKSASTCEQCIQSGPDCGWCMDPNSTLCDTVENLRSELCGQVYNPRGELLILRNQLADGRSILLEPQELSITLRPGVSQVFQLSMRTSDEEPTAMPQMLKTTAVPLDFTVTIQTISTSNPAVFEVTLKADKCPTDANQSENKTGPWFIHINPIGYSQFTKVKVSLECNCECLNKPEPNSPECNTRGTRVCGLCVCQEPYSGYECRTNDNYCRSSPSAPVCSGRGICDNNFCICNKRQDPNEIYSGRFCECSNFECQRFNGSLCGARGKCECGHCVCDEGWTEDDCSCTMDPASCMADNQMICNGHGICLCGVCKCSWPFMGVTCEECATCENRCQRHKSCAECRVFEIGRCDSECGALTVNIVDAKEDIPTTRLCKMMSQKDNCFFYFSYSGSSSTGQLTVAKTKECPRPMYH